MKVKMLSILIVGLISVLFVSCEKNIGTTNVGLLTKQDSIEIEQLTGRKIIGAIDTTLLTSSERESLEFCLKHERNMVIKNMVYALDYNPTDSYSVIHFFYDEKLSCPNDCPDMYVWLSDSEAKRLHQHIDKIKEGDSLITIKGDTILRRIRVMDNSLSVTLGEDYHNGCEGSITIFNLGLRSLTIHSHHHSFCQTHITPGWYERIWMTQNKRKKNRK